MTPRQRVRTAMARGQPDRLPCHVTFNTDTESGPIKTGGPSAQARIMRHLGTDDYEVVLKRLGTDVRTLNPRFHEKTPAQKQKWQAFCEGVQTAQDAEDIHRLDWPTWDLTWDVSHIREDMQKILELDQEYAIQIPGSGLWEVARGLRGFNQSMIDWLTSPGLLVALFECLYQYYMPRYEVMCAELGDAVERIDYVYAGSDFGMQDRPMIAPELFERYYEPFVRREVEQFKKLIPNAFYEFHCCGAISELLPSLVRAGVDVLHPVQPRCTGMGFEELKAKWGGSVAFVGGVDAQGVMAHGTPEDVRQWARYAFRTLGRDGGFLLAPHSIMPEVPAENVLALFGTVRDECWY